ncbi:hypothetical protein DEJ51_00235 [Streptomyces venezuelae]|uniref:Uncharacterized protein n=1 Tax=Streptomyces venezuelae TaxID=54571 RepID=A0A5P2DDR5_STRVZ|nr:hypothetical protein [Streptomyces venezuelae]QES52893.1 hypothetical protein DEJ51_00235 [Streptomyces venezuelae]
MPSPCDSQYAAVGDVGAALMMIDSRLKAIYSGKSGTDPEQQQLVEQFTASLGPEEAEDLVDGACTLIYMFVQWLRMAHEDQGSDVIEYVVPSFVASMRMMPRSVRPEVIPTMVGLVVAAATGLSPNLWRKQYGDWTGDEMNSLEATALLLAEHINRITGDRDFATRMVTDALSRADED